MTSPGQYDEACEMVLKQTEAKLVVVVVIKGKHGNGFSVACCGVDIRPLPDTLRDVASQIEADLRDKGIANDPSRN
jgi:hypothetical protein